MTSTQPTIKSINATQTASTLTVQGPNSNTSASVAVGDLAILVAIGNTAAFPNATVTRSGEGTTDAGWDHHGVIDSGTGGNRARVWTKVLTAADITIGLGYSQIKAVGPTNMASGQAGRLAVAVLSHPDGFNATKTVREFAYAVGASSSIANNATISSFSDPARPAAVVAFGLLGTNASVTFAGTNGASAAHLPYCDGSTSTTNTGVFGQHYGFNVAGLFADFVTLAAAENVSGWSVTGGAANTSHVLGAIIIQTEPPVQRCGGPGNNVNDAQGRARRIARPRGSANTVADATSKPRTVHRPRGRADTVADAKGAARQNGVQRFGGRADAVADAQAKALKRIPAKPYGKADAVADARARARAVHRPRGQANTVCDATNAARRLPKESRTNPSDTVGWAWAAPRRIHRAGGRADAVANARAAVHVPVHPTLRADAVTDARAQARLMHRPRGRADTVVDAKGNVRFHGVNRLSGRAGAVADAIARAVVFATHRTGGRADTVTDAILKPRAIRPRRPRRLRVPLTADSKGATTIVGPSGSTSSKAAS